VCLQSCISSHFPHSIGTNALCSIPPVSVRTAVPYVPFSSSSVASPHGRNSATHYPILYSMGCSSSVLGDCYCGNCSYATSTSVPPVVNEYSRWGTVKFQKDIGPTVPQTCNVLWSHNPLILELVRRRRRIVVARSGLFSPVQNAPETHCLAGLVGHIGREEAPWEAG